MTDDRFIVLTVAFERHAGRGPSLEWIAPELKDAGLSLIEDHPYGWKPSRNWAGLIDGPTFERFADAWHMHDKTGEPTPVNGNGHMTTHTLDGLNWETNGESPIISATVHVWAPGNGHHAGARADHPSPSSANRSRIVL